MRGNKEQGKNYLVWSRCVNKRRREGEIQYHRALRGPPPQHYEGEAVILLALQRVLYSNTRAVKQACNERVSIQFTSHVQSRLPGEWARKSHNKWCTCTRNRLSTQRWSFSGVRELRDNFEPRFAFQQWNRGWSWNEQLKRHSSDWARCQEDVGGIYFTKKVKSWDSTTWLRVLRFQTQAWKGYLQMHLLAERFIFWRWWSGFSETGSQGPSNGTNVAS